MSRVRLLLLASLLVSGVASAGADEPDLIAGVFSPARHAPELALRGTDGEELRLARYRGKVVVLAFGYTSCPTVCPTTLTVLAQTRKKLGEEADRLQIVYVTIDPERDTREHMRDYLAVFDPTFVGGTGTEQQLADVRREYGVMASRQVGGDPTSLSHSSFTYLIDRDGDLRALMPYGHSADDYAHDVRLLLKE